MYNKKPYTLILFISALFLLEGCAPSAVGCRSGAANAGYYCYQGYNFGEHRSRLYKLGVRHGCRTANGHFTKNYGLSRSSQEYLHGWERGRATCKLIPPAEADRGTMRTQYQQSIDERRYYGR